MIFGVLNSSRLRTMAGLLFQIRLCLEDSSRTGGHGLVSEPPEGGIFCVSKRTFFYGDCSGSNAVLGRIYFLLEDNV